MVLSTVAVLNYIQLQCGSRIISNLLSNLPGSVLLWIQPWEECPGASAACKEAVKNKLEMEEKSY